MPRMELRNVRRIFHPRRTVKAIKYRLRPKREIQRFYIHLHGVIHVGAAVGQERQRYANYALDVLWIEPRPPAFERLQKNIKGLRGQRAVQALITEKDGERHTLHISSKGGDSSSTLQLAKHREIWPDIHYVDELEMRGVTLPTLLERERIDGRRYDGLVLDTQGTELSIIRGAAHILSQFRFIKTEVADFESYEGCARLADMKLYLENRGFAELDRRPFANKPGVGTYYDVLFKQGVSLP